MLQKFTFAKLRRLSPHTLPKRRAVVEFMEPRQLFSAVLGSNGILLVAGTSGNDKITVDINESNGATAITVLTNGTVQSFAPQQVKAVQIQASAGNDQIELAGAVDAPNTAPPVTIACGAGADVVGTDLSVVNSNSASIAINAGDGADRFNLNGSNAAIAVSAGNGSDHFNTNISGGGDLNVSITAGDGNDVFFAGAVGGGSQYVTINAGVGQDTVTCTDADDHVSGSLGNQGFTLADDQELLLGKAYLDANGDGHYESTEPTAAGVMVSYSNSYTGTVSTATNSSGDYDFNVLYNADSGPVTTSVAGYSVQLSPGELIGGLDVAQASAGLTGTVIGTGGSYENKGNTIANAFDGNLYTYFDGPTSSTSWAGLDLGTSARTITAINYAPRPGFASRMVGGVFQGSSTADFMSGVVNLYTITTAPEQGLLTTVTINEPSAFRFVRYLGPRNSFCDVAEILFTGHASLQKFSGTVIGTPGSYQNHPTTISNVFDGDFGTYFDAPTASGSWVGLDLGSAMVVTEVKYVPREGFESRMIGGQIQASNTADFSSGVVTLYTVTAAPPRDQFTVVPLSNTTAYRYYRYIGASQSYCNIAELELDG